MGIFVSSKRARHKRFDYQPRFYNPEKDESIKRRMRVRSRTRRRSPMGLVYSLILLMLAIFIYTNLT